MRGKVKHQDQLFSYIPIEQRVPMSHPLRPIRSRVDAIVSRMSPDFERIYAVAGRPSIPPEYLLKSLLLQVLFAIRSERLLLEQLDYNLLFRWFVGIGLDGPVWEETVFSKNRQRLLDGDIADKFFSEVIVEAEREGLISKDHFTVDGTVIQAWASLKSFQKKQDEEAKKKADDKTDSHDTRNPDVNFHGERRSNETHESTTDPEARLYRKSQNQGAQLSYLGHVMMENRNGLTVDHRLTQATGTAERDAAVEMAMGVSGSQRRKTLAADKGYDTKDCVEKLQSLNVTPHVAQNKKRRGGSAIDGRTARHKGYDVSQRIRKRVEETFGWLKTVGPMRQTHFRGQARVAWMFAFSLGAYNLVRMTNLCTS
jgi:transposase/IS5 family transposase